MVLISVKDRNTGQEVREREREREREGERILY